MTDELSIFGYCCTGRLVSARQPTSTITRLTTTARTGCRMKMSVKERMGFTWPFPRPRLKVSETATSTASRSLNEPELATCSPAERPPRMSTSSPSTGPLSTGVRWARGLPLLSAAITNT